MKFALHRSQLQKMIAQRNGYVVLASGSLLLCVVLTLMIFSLLGREKIILVPPTIEKSFWVSANQVSPEYLAEMTGFFAYLRFNVTPENVTAQRETLLRYVDPVYYNPLNSQLVQEADRITQQHITIGFYPTDISVDTRRFQALITGDVKSSMGDVVFPIKRIRYLITYRFDAGRLLVKSFEEVTEKGKAHA